MTYKVSMAALQMYILQQYGAQGDHRWWEAQAVASHMKTERERINWFNQELAVMGCTLRIVRIYNEDVIACDRLITHKDFFPKFSAFLQKFKRIVCKLFESDL